MVDIHTHIIFDVDDGSDTLDESIAILREAARNGVTDIILTPHYIDVGEYNAEKVLQNFEILKKAMPGYFSEKKALYHYWHMAQTNYREYLKGEEV